MVESVTRDFVRGLKLAVATARNQTIDGRTQHTVASAQMCLARAVQQGRANKATQKDERDITRHDSPRVVTSNRRNETLAVLGRAPR